MKIFNWLFGFNQQIIQTYNGNEASINMTNNVIVINGQTYKGSNVSISGDDVTIDGKKFKVGDKTINIEIHGNVGTVESSSGKIKVSGNADKVKSSNGNIEVGQNVNGNVESSNGDVTINGNVLGSVKTTNGNIKYIK